MDKSNQGAADNEYDFIDPDDYDMEDFVVIEAENLTNNNNRDQEEQKMEGVDEEVHTQPINEPVSQGAKPNPLLSQQFTEKKPPETTAAVENVSMM